MNTYGTTVLDKLVKKVDDLKPILKPILCPECWLARNAGDVSVRCYDSRALRGLSGSIGSLGAFKSFDLI
jgi:hypothetical protein